MSVCTMCALLLASGKISGGSEGVWAQTQASIASWISLTADNLNRNRTLIFYSVPGADVTFAVYVTCTPTVTGKSVAA